MQRKINILHLSDLHIEIGNESQDAILEQLNEAVKFRKKVNPVDFIVVTGDIVNRGEKDEFDKAAKFLSEIYKSVGFKPSDANERSRIIACPGNHDVQRKILKEVLLKKIQSSEELKNALKEPKQHGYYKYLIDEIKSIDFAPAFKNYNSFCRKLGITNLRDWTSKEISDDFTQGYVDFEDVGVRFNVLNSAIFSLGPEWIQLLSDLYQWCFEAEIENEEIGGAQQEEIVLHAKRTSTQETFKWLKSTISRNFVGPDYGLMQTERFTLDNDLESKFINISLIHHPPSWLQQSLRDGNNKSEGYPFFDKIADISSCILYGHEHTGMANNYTKYKGKTHLIAAGAVFTKHPIYGQGFSYLHINREERKIFKRPLYADPDKSPPVFNNNQQENILIKDYNDCATIPEIRKCEIVHNWKTVLSGYDSVEIAAGSTGKKCECCPIEQRCFYQRYIPKLLPTAFETPSMLVNEGCKVISKSEDELPKGITVLRMMYSNLATQNGSGESILYLIVFGNDFFENFKEDKTIGEQIRLMLAKVFERVLKEERRPQQKCFIQFTVDFDYYLNSDNYKINNENERVEITGPAARANKIIKRIIKTTEVELEEADIDRSEILLEDQNDIMNSYFGEIKCGDLNCDPVLLEQNGIFIMPGMRYFGDQQLA